MLRPGTQAEQGMKAVMSHVVHDRWAPICKEVTWQVSECRSQTGGVIRLALD